MHPLPVQLGGGPVIAGPGWGEPVHRVGDHVDGVHHPGGVERLVGSINDARKRRAAAAYVDACLEEAPQPPPAQPVAVIKPPTQPLRGLSPVAMRAVKAGRANVAQRTPPGLSASSLPVTPMDAAMGSRARASGVPATPVAYAPAVSGRAPSVLDAALGARQAIPINPSTRVSASSTAPSVLDAALGSRDRAAVVKPVTSSVPTGAARENYAEAALKQMQQRASAMDEVAARRRAHERDALVRQAANRSPATTNWGARPFTRITTASFFPAPSAAWARKPRFTRYPATITFTPA